MRDYCCRHIFRYRFSPETFGYTLVAVAVAVTATISTNHVVVRQDRWRKYGWFLKPHVREERGTEPL
jgi:hypothetical protein